MIFCEVFIWYSSPCFGQTVLLKWRVASYLSLENLNQYLLWPWWFRISNLHSIVFWSQLLFFTRLQDHIYLKSINVSRFVIEGLPRAPLNLPFLQICASHRSKCLSNVLILDCGFYFSSKVKVLHKQSKRRHIWCHAAP